MQYIPEGTGVVLWGIGTIGKQVLEGVFGNYKICFAVDSKVNADTVDKIEDITVYSPQELDEKSLEDRLLVISIYRWQEVAAELEKKGKHIFRDYIPYTYLQYSAIDISFFQFCKSDDEKKKILKDLSGGKKLCGLYGFCHMNFYKPLLLRSEQFTGKYCLIDLPTANDTSPNRDLLNMPWIYSILDTLILGFVYPGEHLGTPDWKTVKSWVSSNCDVILVPNAAFKGYFPQNTTGITQTKKQICWGDKNLNKMILEGKTADEMIRTVSSPDFYSAEEVNRFYENALNKLELGESECDVQIGDYIRKYGRQKRLMYSSTHPRECVMKELTIRIFARMGFDTEIIEAMPENDLISFKTHGEFIYPSVYRALGIKEREENEKACVGDDINDEITFPEYVDLYMEINKPYITG